jgi:TMEM175 potassium channel family protein
LVTGGLNPRGETMLREAGRRNPTGEKEPLRMEDDLAQEEEEALEGEALGIDRVNNFSDAVFAVAITLLILTIDVPVISNINQLPSEMKAMWPKFQGFLISFAIIGAFWISHHVIFRHIRRHKRMMLWINLLFLMFIVLLPFSTDLMSEYNDSVLAVVFYDLNMIAASLSLLLLLWYVSYKFKLVDDTLDPATRWHLSLNFMTTSVIFALSAGVAFISASNSQYLYLLLIPSGAVLERTHKKKLKSGRQAGGPK